MEINKEKEGGKRILDSLKRIGIFSAVVAVLLIFFSVSSLIASIGGNVKNKITGDVIVIQGPGDKYNISVEYKEIKNELNDNLVCWIDGGINKQDIVVIGNILKDIECPSAEKKNVKAEMKDDCLVITVDNEVTTKLCTEEENPTINIEIVKAPENSDGAFPGDLSVPEKNLYWYVLFFFILIVIVLFWREFEFQIREDLEMRAEMAYMRKKAAQMAKKPEVKEEPKEEILEVSAAPIYDEEAYKKKIKEKEKIEKELEKDAAKKKKDKDARTNELIAKFNNKAERINDLIIKGNLGESRKSYLELFDVYSELSQLADENMRKTTDRMMEYLCNYLGALEKLKGTKRVGFREMIQDDDETIRAKPQILSMEKLNEMKEMIQKKHYDQARTMFYGSNMERIGLNEAARNVTSKKEKDELAEIEARHDKILKKGMINVAEDDFYGFMHDMSELRKELKRRR